MKKILILVVAVLLLLGAVVGGLIFWGMDPLAMVGLKKGDLTNKAKEAAAAAVAAIPVAQPTYVDFGLLVVPVVINHEVRSQADLVIRLQVNDKKVEDVAKYMPRLQAAFVEDMMEFIPKVLHDYGMLDMAVIRNRLVEVGARVYGPDVIQAVIIENMMYHQL